MEIFTCSSKLSNKYLLQPTQYVNDISWTDWQNEKIVSYTVVGSGFVYASASAISSSNSDTGTVYAIILLNNVRVAYDYDRLVSAGSYSVGANASSMFAVSNGDVIQLTLYSSKGGTANGLRRILDFGCTLTTS